MSIVEPAPELRIHRERRKRMWRRTFYSLLGAVMTLIVGVAVWGYAFVNAVEDDLQKPESITPELSEQLTEPEPKEPITILLLGSDVRPDEEAARADTIIVARVDLEEKKVWMLSIPRDTRVEIPGHGVSKINAANFYGGPALMVETVKGFLGIDINHYMEIDFTGFEAMVDALGGVWIDVPVEIDDWKAASHSPGHRAKHIDPGYQLLDGEHALTFVRSRDFPDADWQRMRNQQLFFRELASQSTRWENVFKLPGVVREFAEYAVTDMSVSEMIDVGRSLAGISEDDIQATTLPGEWRSPYVYVDEAEKERLVTALMAGEPFEPPVEEQEFAPSEVRVAVRNGGGVDGAATEASDALKSQGYVVVEVGNANQFVYDKTLIVYADEVAERKASMVAEALGIGTLVPSRGMYSYSGDVLVVVGEDWASRTPGGALTNAPPD